MDASPAEGYVYHNTIIGGRAALAYGFHQKLDQAAPRWHYVNNLVVGTRGFFDRAGRQAPVDFEADYNTVTGGHRPYTNDPRRDAHSRYVDDVALTPGLHPPRSPPAPPSTLASTSRPTSTANLCPAVSQVTSEA